MNRLFVRRLSDVFVRRCVSTLLVVCCVFLSQRLPQVRADSLAPVEPAAPVSPILLVVNSAAPNPFGAYLAEILKSEGLNAFDTVALSALTPADLAGREVAVLSETPLSAAQATLLSGYVNGGGRLVAMRPDAQIAPLFGLQTKAGELNSAYVSIDTQATLDGAAPGEGLPSVPLQYHGIADLYSVQPSGVPLARLFNNPTAPSTYPAVVRFNSGSGIGVAFTYDLARNVVLTRQGNPASGPTATRAGDLYRPQNGVTWLDLDLANLPQADEHQRLFARIVSQLAAASRPVPRLWYFPNRAKSVMLVTANSNSSPVTYFTDVTNTLASRGTLGTFFIGIGGLQRADLQTMLNAGHSVSPWVFDVRDDPFYPPLAITSLQQGFVTQTDWYKGLAQADPARTVRTYNAAWKGWADAAQFAADQGYGMDLSLAVTGTWLQRPNGAWARGYLNGSGRPMRFTNAAGAVLPVYQQSTELVEEHLLGGFDPFGESLPLPDAVAVSRQRIDAAVDGNYAAVVAQVQVGTYGFGGGVARSWLESTMDYAVSRTVPFLTGQQWWAFNETRDSARYTQVAWDNTAGKLAFNLEVTATPGVSLTTLVPVIYKNRSLRQILVDGVNTPFVVDNVKAANLAWVTVPAGNHSFEATYLPDAPIGNLTAAVVTTQPNLVLYQPIQFSASVDSGTNVTYLWDFGDGVTGSGPNPTHTYKQYGSGGSYAVKVTASNGSGTRTSTLQVSLKLPQGGFLPLIQTSP